jgi:hypothetical protein
LSKLRRSRESEGHGSRGRGDYLTPFTLGGQQFQVPFHSVLHDEDKSIAAVLRGDGELEANPSVGLSPE